MYTEEINRNSVSSNHNKRFQTFDRITYPYGSSVGKVCKTAILSKHKGLILMNVQMKIKQNII